MNALEEMQVQTSQLPLEGPSGRAKEVTTLTSEVSSQLAPTRTKDAILMPRSSLCRSCKTENRIDRYRCPLGCAEQLCSAQCYLKHRKSCSHAILDRLKVLIVSQKKKTSWWRN